MDKIEIIKASIDVMRANYEHPKMSQLYTLSHYVEEVMKAIERMEEIEKKKPSFVPNPAVMPQG